jgi:cephalosporin hydroxylase
MRRQLRRLGRRLLGSEGPQASQTIKVGRYRPPTAFEPLGPDDLAVVDRFHQLYYRERVEGRRTVLLSWLGYPLYKCPFDLWTYQEIIADTRPEVIVECGTRYGGGALFMAALFDLLGAGQVISIDIDTSIDRPAHRRITYLTGSTIDPELFERVRAMTAGRKTMVILDSDHSAAHVAKELELYPDLVSPGYYLIVDDTNVNGHPAVPDHGPGPMEALVPFLEARPDFQADPARERFMLSLNPKGFVRRVEETPKAAS